MVAFLLLPANANIRGTQTKLDRVSSEQIGSDAYDPFAAVGASPLSSFGAAQHKDASAGEAGAESAAAPPENLGNR